MLRSSHDREIGRLGVPALGALALGWGMTGVWAGLLALVGVRPLTLGARFANGRWAITGAAARPPRA